ncbi:MAG: PQQ-binding-like beta-propeller repeat protein [Planctomycetota bacterium]
MYGHSIQAIAVFLLVCSSAVRGEDWPQWRGPQRDGVWRESGIVKSLPKELKFKWKTPIGAGYTGPAVANGRVYVTDRLLDKDAQNPENPFSRDAVGGTERVLCLDAETGKILWAHEYPCRYTISYPAGPRATPTVHQGKVYSVGAMGNFFCLDAETGKVLWSKDYVKDFGFEVNTWGASAPALIDGDNVILLVGGKNDSNVVALNKDTGAEVWHSLYAADPCRYCPPMISRPAGARQLIIWEVLFLYPPSIPQPKNPLATTEVKAGLPFRLP